MKFSFLILVNALTMMLFGFLEFQNGNEARLIPLLFLFLGVITLTMNNTVVSGSTSIGKVVLFFIVISFIALIEPIHNSYIRYHMNSVFRYSIIAGVNFITILALVKFIFFDQKPIK